MTLTAAMLEQLGDDVLEGLLLHVAEILRRRGVKTSYLAQRLIEDDVRASVAQDKG